jgi:stalled ribosome rescue protein Dom34
MVRKLRPELVLEQLEDLYHLSALCQAMVRKLRLGLVLEPIEDLYHLSALCQQARYM